MADTVAHSLGPIFLSASVPLPGRGQVYLSTANILGIREAVAALTVVVLPTDRLVFGGHPAISPLVHLAAERLGAADRVYIYQSAFFQSVIPPSSLRFRHIIWTPPGVDRSSSLLRMREQMIGSEDFRAGVFIGGMDGVEEEFELFRRHHPKAALLAVASTGAAARVIFDREPWGVKDVGLKFDAAYASLFRRLLSRAAGSTPPPAGLPPLRGP
ncbi:SLOG domain-containing protein [Myxococcus landrumensis]|uniref:Uncharacterized protein n=1 Tax=Myxococcus landrumensis TaxID=2813577 RepID=A0ABX7NGG5_9BACT|nr:hypothetical protein [Myxococcus landrumus]QSQ17922.1 hypothetical protein JY572_18635 [Myxococcus landrumus]